MSNVTVTDTYTIKTFCRGTMFTIQNYHNLDNTLIQGEDAELFNLELDNIFNCSNMNEVDNKLDILCGQFL